MSDIFISYSHNDRSKAEVIARALTAVGYSVWWDRSIPAGKEFDEAIEAALNEARLAIVLWSQYSVRSRWVLTEASDAVDRGILMPILIERKVRIPLAFKRIQAADLIDWDGSVEAPAFQALVADIAERIGAGRNVPEPTPTLELAEEERGSAAHAQSVQTMDVDDAQPAPDDAGNMLADDLKPPRPGLLETRAGLTWILAGVFAVNYVETMIESVVRNRFGWGVEFGNRMAAAFRGLEGNLSFESHDVTNWVAVYGYSVAYFFVLPVLALGVGVALWRRNDVHAYRILCLSVAADYLISLGFFLFFPVPERWSYADSGAILLSDRWSSSLVELLRPISAMDNCFPSTHVSLTVLIVVVSYVFGLRLRHTMFAAGLSVILSTFVLGIHWIPDIVAGVAVGVLSVAAAHYVKPARRSSERRLPALATAVLGSRPVPVGALVHS